MGTVKLLEEEAMAFKDLRQFIEALDETGDLVRVKQEVDWDLEAGAIGRRAYEQEGPAVLFEKVKDYPPGYRLLNGCVGTYRRTAIAMGLPPDTPIRSLFAEYESRENNPIKPVVVGSGPCKENIVLKEDVDLNCLPAPMMHDGDGGRYIGSWDIVVSKDPDSGWTNWGMYRFMVHSESYLVGYPVPQSHLWLTLMNKYIPQDRPMPIALVIGADPLSHIAASATPSIGQDEADYAGGLRQEPVELVKCETSDILVPAHAEIVIEGEILPDKTAPEGPFGEYTGYRRHGVNAGALCRVTAITHRDSPILTMTPLGLPADETHTASAMATALAIKRRLRRHQLPVSDVFCAPEGTLLLVIVAVESRGREVAERVAEVLTARRLGPSKVIVVENDVNIFNLKEVVHAFVTRCHPGRGIIVKEYEGKANPMNPHYSFEERKTLKGATVVFDCTWPKEWSNETEIPMTSSFEQCYPRELQEAIIKNWKEYGFR